MTESSRIPEPAAWIRRTSQLFLALLVLGFPAESPALILDSGDGLGNTTSPDPDPGWDNVGQHLGSPSVVYLGNRWILTADHVGASIVILKGTRYDPVAGSLVRLVNPDQTIADLLLFRIAEDPSIPNLRIANSPPASGESVVLIGAGSSRSVRLAPQALGDTLIDGFAWQKDQTKRWGSNTIDGPPQIIEQESSTTRALSMTFDRIESPAGTRQEATAARGDSGGAVFSRADPENPESHWVLSGILFSVGTRTGFPQRASFYGDVTWAADLSFYKDQILENVWPEGYPGELARQAPEPEPAPDHGVGIILMAGASIALLVAFLVRNSLGPKS